jgi:hypothetical protein
MADLGDLLAELVEQVPSRFVMVLDGAGQSLVWRGDAAGQNIVTLSSLVAADLAASREIGRLSGETQDYHMILREGERTHTFICAAGSRLIVFAMVPTEVPLGWSRRLILDAARRIETIPSRVIETAPPSSSGRGLPSLADDLSRAIEGLWLE